MGDGVVVAFQGKSTSKKISLIHYISEIKICKDTNGAIYQGMWEVSLSDIVCMLGGG